jgi:hypothetical protein
MEFVWFKGCSATSSFHLRPPFSQVASVSGMRLTLHLPGAGRSFWIDMELWMTGRFSTTAYVLHGAISIINFASVLPLSLYLSRNRSSAPRQSFGYLGTHVRLTGVFSSSLVMTVKYLRTPTVKRIRLSFDGPLYLCIPNPKTVHQLLLMPKCDGDW